MRLLVANSDSKAGGRIKYRNIVRQFVHCTFSVFICFFEMATPEKKDVAERKIPFCALGNSNHCESKEIPFSHCGFICIVSSEEVTISVRHDYEVSSHEKLSLCCMLFHRRHNFYAYVFRAFLPQSHAV